MFLFFFFRLLFIIIVSSHFSAFLIKCLLLFNQDAKKLAGEEPAWKEVKDAVNEVKYPKSKEGILSVQKSVILL